MNKLYVNSLDAWLATQPLVLKRKKTVIPVVMQRDTLAESLARQLMRLNSPELRRRTKQRTLKDYIEEVTNGEGSG